VVFGKQQLFISKYQAYGKQQRQKLKLAAFGSDKIKAMVIYYINAIYK
jgi:hypothetical protein